MIFVILNNKLAHKCICGKSSVYREELYGRGGGHIIGIQCVTNSSFVQGSIHSLEQVNYTPLHDKKSRKSLILELISDWNENR